MVTWRNRETRRTVRISVRVRTDAGWIDATVRNLSTRGMMLDSPQPLRRNQFVEVTRGHRRVVGRIVWSEAERCGLHSQDMIDIAGLLATPGTPSGVERRSQSRAGTPAPRRPVGIADQAHFARLVGRTIERGALVIAGAAVAALIAAAALDTLARPFEQVDAVLAP
ncbi:PilZ domain-containing protein [Qipengyuania sediminis]|uniref:PilZ domain-containing protein n=1 Tax=Qipengyuania sediminis TaxID=1532023 RepID=UPI0010597DF6|nr:PilZ domain-containing protein [Qipengyuania sediminis]